ncbi:MAG: beta-ketoacyl synthase chain length factor [Chitinophagales bacterium]
MQNIYINGSACISPQPTFEEVFPFTPIEKVSNHILIEKPEYKKYISPIRLRRMKHIVRMGIATANRALKEAGISNPDAIISGTAMGCLEDTEKFLTSILENKEELLNPTAFIQSTHNTVGGQIALLNKCMNYNFTYAHRGFSYENALFDALMMLGEGTAENVLVGAVDEATHNYFLTTGRLGYWKKDTEVNNLNLLNHDSSGSILGEGAAFFVLSNKKSDHSKAIFKGAQLIYKPEAITEVSDKANLLLKNAGLEFSDIDLLLCGLNGDNRQDHLYYEMAANLGIDTIGYFKHLCGEYHSVGAFANWLAAKMLQHNTVPEYVIHKGKVIPQVKNILIYNHYYAQNHSLILMSAVS